MGQLVLLEDQARGRAAHLVAENAKVAHAKTCFVAVRVADRAAVLGVAVVHLLD